MIDRWITDAPADGRPFLWLTEIDRRTEVDNPGSWETALPRGPDRDPDLDAARHGLAESLRKVHRNDEAAKEYERYLARHPDDPIALAGRGSTHWNWAIFLGPRGSWTTPWRWHRKTPPRSRAEPRSPSTAATWRPPAAGSTRRSRPTRSTTGRSTSEARCGRC